MSYKIESILKVLFLAAALTGMVGGDIFIWRLVN